MEKSVFFKNSQNQDLFGTVYLPTKGSNGRGIVICQAIAEEKIRVKRVFVNFSRFLSSNGYCVFLFDYFGEGDSGGSFEEADVESRIQDITDAILFFRAETGIVNLGIMGLRLGASLGYLAAQSIAGIDYLIMIQPVINGLNYFQEWMKANLSAQLVIHKKIVFDRKKLEQMIKNGEVIEIEGYVIGKNFCDQLNALDISISPSKVTSKVYLVSMTKNNKVDAELEARFVAHVNAAGDECEYLSLEKTFDWISMKNYHPCPSEQFDRILQWIGG